MFCDIRKSLREGILIVGRGKDVIVELVGFGDGRILLRWVKRLCLEIRVEVFLLIVLVKRLKVLVLLMGSLHLLGVFDMLREHPSQGRSVMELCDWLLLLV